MTTFEVPTGQRVNITAGSVFLAFLDTGTREEIQQDVNYNATATDQFQVGPDGVIRRLFVDADRTFPNGENQIWLSNVVHGDGKESTTASIERAWPNTSQMPEQCRMLGY